MPTHTHQEHSPGPQSRPASPSLGNRVLPAPVVEEYNERPEDSVFDALDLPNDQIFHGMDILGPIDWNNYGLTASSGIAPTHNEEGFSYPFSYPFSYGTTMD
jgi:hypothetical protein